MPKSKVVLIKDKSGEFVMDNLYKIGIKEVEKSKKSKNKKKSKKIRNSKNSHGMKSVL